MKSLKQYLDESSRSYHYKIKIVGDCDAKCIDLFKMNLKKFNPVRIGDVTQTPVQIQPIDFPGFYNERVNIIDCEFRYPATEPMVRQIWKLCKVDGGKTQDENRVRVIDSFGSEIDDQQQERIQTGADYEEEAKAAAKDYGDSYLEVIRKQFEENKMKYEFASAAEKTSDPFKREADKILSPISGASKK